MLITAYFADTFFTDILFFEIADIFLAAAEGAPFAILFEYYALAVGKDLDGVVDLKIKSVAKILGDQNTSQFIYFAYAVCGFQV